MKRIRELESRLKLLIEIEKTYSPEDRIEELPEIIRDLKIQIKTLKILERNKNCK